MIHMSDTLIDMPKVTQMLDAGWVVTLYKNELDSYTCTASREYVNNAADETVSFITDDFTPEQALTRLAYKILGEIL